MASLFDDASNHYLEAAAAAVAAAPLTMAGWFRTDDLAINQTILGLFDASTGNNYFSLYVAGATGGDPVRFYTRSAAGNSMATTTTGVSVNTWHHACAVRSAVNAGAAYIDGGSKGTNSTSVTPTGIDTMSIGRNGDSSPNQYFSGRLAESGLWNVALNDSEIAALAAGLSPLRMRPLSLVGYWPVWGIHSPEIDLTSSANSMAVTGATLVNGPPVEPFSRRWWGSAPLIESGVGLVNRGLVAPPLLGNRLVA